MNRCWLKHSQFDLLQVFLHHRLAIGTLWEYVWRGWRMQHWRDNTVVKEVVCCFCYDLDLSDASINSTTEQQICKKYIFGVGYKPKASHRWTHTAELVMNSWNRPKCKDVVTHSLFCLFTWLVFNVTSTWIIHFLTSWKRTKGKFRQMFVPQIGDILFTTTNGSFQDNEVILQTGYDVIVIPLQNWPRNPLNMLISYW